MAEDIHIIPHTIEIVLIPKPEFDRVKAAPISLHDKLPLLADMSRINTLSAIKKAGSGHLGASLSAMDMVTWLYHHEMNTAKLGVEHPDRDVYFSSKGHDVPGLYSVLYSAGILSQEKLLKLRRFGGLDGHPDVGITGIEANSGSLGMGISKGKGMALAKRLRGNGGRVFVMVGDGELQEGQNYEGLRSAAMHHIGNLIVLVDHNKVQSDKLVSEISDLGDLESIFASFGWYVARCDGHDFQQIEQAFGEFEEIHSQPKILIADTIKGCGVSFMEHPNALKTGSGLYPWHAGAPDDEAFISAQRELLIRLSERCRNLDLPPLVLETIPPEEKIPSNVSAEYVADAYGQALVAIGATRQDMVVLDADLAADCRIRHFERAYPERFVEIGIAEQDMVSTAAGLARLGMLPVVNSFASFLASRSNEQIYNAVTERTRIIYACHYAGLIPAAPGKSHQSLRDVSLFGTLPNMIILQPSNSAETHMVVDYCVNTATENCMIRLAIGPSPRLIQLPKDYTLVPGRGVTLREGSDALLFAYGPVMLHEALLASEILAEQGFGLQVVNTPWLNRLEDNWFQELVTPYQMIYVLDDHAPVGGLGDYLLNALARLELSTGRRFDKLAVEGFPACGTPPQALQFHQLDGNSLARRIKNNATN